MNSKSSHNKPVPDYVLKIRARRRRQELRRPMKQWLVEKILGRYDR